MKTMGETVLEHVKKTEGNRNSTTIGLDLLELPYSEKNFFAANMYLAALGVIEKLQDKITGFTELENLRRYGN